MSLVLVEVQETSELASQESQVVPDLLLGHDPPHFRSPAGIPYEPRSSAYDDDGAVSVELHVD